MAIPIKILRQDGTLADSPIKAESINEIALNEPHGIYTVARTFKRKCAVLLDAHLDRLEESARLEGIPFSLDRMAIRKGLQSIMDEGGFEESRFRITIPKDQPDQIWLAVEPLPRVPLDLQRAGVRTLTHDIIRPNPQAKSNAWVAIRNEVAAHIPEDVYEGIIVSPEGKLMEGFTSNFYAIRDGTLITAGAGILYGIARAIVLDIAPEILPVSLETVHMEELSQLEETFLTSSSRGIVPIIKINEVTIGTGVPGEMTLHLREVYDRWVETHLEPILPD